MTSRVVPRPPVPRTSSAADVAAEAIRTSVMNGDARGGAPVREEEWADRLSLSRTPVREAINKLVTEGLLTRNGRTAYVFQPSLEDLLDIYDMRLALETLAARRAAERSTPELVKGLTERFDAIKGLTPDGDWFHDHEEFHMFLFAGGGSERLCAMIAALRAQSEPYLRFAIAADRPFRVQSKTQHRAMVAAVRRRDPDAIAAVVNEHLMRTRREVVNLMEAGWNARPIPAIGVAQATAIARHRAAKSTRSG
jgi:DNA-binding GntR family transcriptional regulator